MRDNTTLDLEIFFGVSLHNSYNTLVDVGHLNPATDFELSWITDVVHDAQRQQDIVGRNVKQTPIRDGAGYEYDFYGRLGAKPDPFGTKGVDIVSGKSHYMGFEGDDSITGTSGNDTLYGGAGIDRLLAVMAMTDCWR